MGQTNYEYISSIMGPCYYPAGHLWHFLMFYKIYMNTVNGL